MTRPTQKEVEQARIRAVCGMIYNKDGPDEVFRAWIVRVYDAYLELDRENVRLQDVFQRHRAREQYFSDIIYHHIKHGDEKHQQWLKDKLDEILTREGQHTQTWDDLLTKNKALTSILADFHARMMDTYDGAPDSNNRMPFDGGDLYELERVLR